MSNDVDYDLAKNITEDDASYAIINAKQVVVNMTIYQTAHTTLFAVHTPKELKGLPIIPLPDPSELLDYATDVSISRSVVDAWNIYSLENGATKDETHNNINREISEVTRLAN
ncbi:MULTISPECIES: hypothetical protein [Candidatus Nitrosocaldus]|jgi:hypothetical protein|uniref:Uncharacterized protein n=1 Tax=Candidatus Nitrosocaldus cavascurensis TaxID=2058097 RepID=A0A2K5AQD7_9ARCH|nr:MULTISPECIES: hypothetical protein [Candidatus Nitrosocaldus]SPC33819.1 protein of unknown function [Candidatus Nitrosocaldus cavascurensis]